MKKQVFVSYTKTDMQVAYGIVDFLEKNGVSCFIAPRDVEGGKAYAAVLMNALEACDLVALIASEATNASEHVLNEVDVIVEKGKTIVPIFLEDFELNADFRYYLGRKQRVVAYPDGIDAYYGKILDTIIEKLPKVSIPLPVQEEQEELKNTSKTTVFEYKPERGIMINPEDHQRNVSFRTDTFVNMMGGIFEKVKDLVGEEDAEHIFYNSGYTSGKNFAERINNQWDTGYSLEGIKAKLAKWCEFDSAVGWGKFSTNVEIDEENDSLTGSICINEAFIVDNKKKRKICSFIKGYCSGVVEILLNSSEVELVCRECPLKSNFKTQCIFDIKTK